MDMEARNALLANKITVSIIKCTNGYNQYRIQEETMNKNRVTSKYPRYSRPEN